MIKAVLERTARAICEYSHRFRRFFQLGSVFEDVHFARSRPKKPGSGGSQLLILQPVSIHWLGDQPKHGMHSQDRDESRKGPPERHSVVAHDNHKNQCRDDRQGFADSRKGERHLLLKQVT